MERVPIVGGCDCEHNTMESPDVNDNDIGGEVEKKEKKKRKTDVTQ